MTDIKPALIERAGIEIIPESERTAKPRDLFWPWFAANVSVFGMSYGSFVLGFGISFWQATIVSVIGIVVSFLLCGLIAIAGKRGFGADHGALARRLRRAGAEGARHRLVADLDRLGDLPRDHGRARHSHRHHAARRRRRQHRAEDHRHRDRRRPDRRGLRLGYHTIMKLQSVLTWVTGAVTILYIVLAAPSIDLAAVMAAPMVASARSSAHS